MHPVRGGAGGEGKEVALHPCSPVSVSMVSPCPGGDGGGRGRGEVERGLWVPPVAGAAHSRGLRSLSARAVQGSWSQPRSVSPGCRGTPKGSGVLGTVILSCLQTLSSSGNHASPALTSRFILTATLGIPLLSLFICAFCLSRLQVNSRLTTRKLSCSRGERRCPTGKRGSLPPPRPRR